MRDILPVGLVAEILAQQVKLAERGFLVEL
jgi:hypothetical protein